MSLPQPGFIADINQPSFEIPVKITKSDSARFERPRALWVGTAGTATLIYRGGQVADFPLLAGLNPIGGMVGVATGGSADDIWALY